MEKSMFDQNRRETIHNFVKPFGTTDYMHVTIGPRMSNGTGNIDNYVVTSLTTTGIRLRYTSEYGTHVPDFDMIILGYWK